ncbi:anti-sigma-I factor RsgI family protein [Clostridium intestinale]|jgi:hypothetical protein|uniref:RsgI N-terminal anti-sigma domain-containing protein n=1 Tax=Clostridium intestinale URNW TaxID=1294142 RepID=U2NGM3_9CLOT|nr:hypothetical protein [Clostridium intestinale]ERK28263.1 hypothetical protein CINTURNW_4272 [Clostridium intestinale URNW]ERK28570.1 hypothetical protein CINTURNW_4267 [Clostridium intestinale URNW]
MKGIVLEKKDGYAVLVDKQGKFHKVKDKNDIVVGSEYERSMFLRLNKGLVFKVSALMIAGTLGIFGYNAYAVPNAYVSLDINPSVELATNSFGTVIDVNPLNEDGEKLSEDLTLEGQKVEDALQTLIVEAKTEGYLDESLDNAVAVTVSTDDEAKGEDILQSAEEAVKSELENQNLENAEIIAQNINTERHKEAERLGISPGKMLLIEKLKAADLEVNDEEYANKPVREIMKALNAKRAEDRAEAKEIKKDAKKDKDSSVEDNSLLGGTEQSSNEAVTEEKVETKSINKNDEKQSEKTTEVKSKANNSPSDNSQKGQQQSENDNSNSQEKSNNSKDKENNASEKSKGNKPNGK